MRIERRGGAHTLLSATAFCCSLAAFVCASASLSWALSTDMAPFILSVSTTLHVEGKGKSKGKGGVMRGASMCVCVCVGVEVGGLCVCVWW